MFISARSPLFYYFRTLGRWHVHSICVWPTSIMKTSSLLNIHGNRVWSSCGGTSGDILEHRGLVTERDPCHVLEMLSWASWACELLLPSSQSVDYFFLFQHISSRRHKDRAAGKPAKPKYSPYSKAQRGPATQTVRGRHPYRSCSCVCVPN